MSIIYNTKRFLIRELELSDFDSFHLMQSNKNVMKYVRGRPMTYEENRTELPQLIDFYSKENNDFFIYAIERKDNHEFVGTVALVKDNENEDEIGYRFLEKNWGNGYGTEVLNGLIEYCKLKKMKKIIANVAVDNKASLHMIQNAGFIFVENFVSEDLNISEQKYILKL